MLAGSQLSSAVRSDYQDRLVSETNLVAEGVRQYLGRNASGSIDQTEIAAALAAYQGQIEGTVSFEADTRPNFPPGNNPPPGSNNPPLQNRAGQTNIQQQNGDLLITAPITVDAKMLGRLEVRVPSSSIDKLSRSAGWNWGRSAGANTALDWRERLAVEYPDPPTAHAASIGLAPFAG